MTVIEFSHEILNLVHDFLVKHEQPGAPNYGSTAGPQIRHVIEHYEALLLTGSDHVIDYDARARDSILESNLHEASKRITTVKSKLYSVSLAQAIKVRSTIGLAGQGDCVLDSTIGRELMFLATHAIHHCALLIPYCRENNIPVPVNFGYSPGTIKHLNTQKQQTKTNGKTHHQNN